MKIQPSKAFEGSELIADAIEQFTAYIQSLNWGPGQRDVSAWNAFLRAGSLGVEPDTAAEAVATCIRVNGGTFDSAKLKSQLRRAYDYVGINGGSTVILPKPPKYEFAAEKLKAIASKVEGINSKWLEDHSPIPPSSVSSSQFLECLYQPGEKIVVFTEFESQGQHVYEVGGDPKIALPDGGPDGVWFLTNPVDGQYHPNPRQENKQSRRSEESVTSWSYLVLENDTADADDWLACLVQLPLRIVAIYTSGGKSIHALVRVDAESKSHWDEIKNEIKPVVVTLGADPNALTAVRLSRLPGTMRGENQQKLLYLDPDADGTPIITKHTQTKTE